MTQSDVLVLRALEIFAAPTAKAKRLWIEEARFHVEMTMKRTAAYQELKHSNKEAK